jgi:hypothetical protein
MALSQSRAKPFVWAKPKKKARGYGADSVCAITNWQQMRHFFSKFLVKPFAS